MNKTKFKKLFSEMRRQKTDAFNSGGGSELVKSKWSKIDSVFSELMGFSTALIFKPTVKGDTKACSANLIIKMNYPDWVFETVSYN